MMGQEILLSKFKGSMIGTAIGDALGSSFEGQYKISEDQVHDSVEQRRTLTYTDDTHMMIGVAESLIENKGFDGKHMAYQFIENFFKEPFRGYGPGPPRIFWMINAGEAWDKACEKVYPGGSYGNGAAMRIAPVGLFYNDTPRKMEEVSYGSSHITHAHILGKEGAALEAYAIALATNLTPTLPFGRSAFLNELKYFVKHDIYKQKLQKIEMLLGEADKTRVVTELGNGVEAFNSVPAAIFSFLSYPYSFEEAVVYAITLGGDTDTIGAMTGAISGAYLGNEAIPEKWVDKLERAIYLEGLADKLWRVKKEA